MGKLEGKAAVVTGGGRGIGRAICIGFAKEGADVVVNYATKDQPAREVVEVIQGMGKKAVAVKGNVAVKADVERIMQTAVDQFGKIDILVNNAAIIPTRKSFNEIPPAEFQQVLTTNVMGVWLTTRAVSPHMKEHGKGKIINIASETFFTGSHGFAHYVATKGAIVGLTRALAVELGPDHICINAIAPGFTDTEGSRTIADVTKYDVSRTPLRRLGTAEDIMGAAVFLSSDASDFVTGQTILVDGGRAMH